jgi:hypothetical protein
MIGYTILGNVNFYTVERFDISKNGIQVVENSEQVIQEIKKFNT